MSVKIKKNTSETTENTPDSKTADDMPPAAPEATNITEERGAHPLQSLRREIDALFDNFLSGFPSARFMRPHFDMDTWREPFLDPFKRFEDSFSALSRFAMRTDMKETDKAFTITAELPGVAEDDIDVSVCDGRLTIKAEKKEESREDDENVHLSERHYGSIRRAFTLPDSADPDKAKAGFKDGVLTIDIPKRPQPKAETKKIPITK